MSQKLITALATCLVVLGLAASPAWGQQAQATDQLGLTGQQAAANPNAGQNAVNANVPVSIAGGTVSVGNSSAVQNASNAASASAANASTTVQLALVGQTGGSSSCKWGCGGAGQFQVVVQDAATEQQAEAKANADQNAVNANVPVSIAGGDVKAGDSSAEQNADNAAKAKAGNESKTVQLASAEQTGGSSSCHAGCGGDGQFQAVLQSAATEQEANAKANADQNAVNANAPVSIAGGDVRAGDSSAVQNADNAAKAKAGNESVTLQAAEATQTGGSSSCKWGCGGAGQFQVVVQDAATEQKADAKADADQNAVNANAPVSIAGGDVNAGESSAEQEADNAADAKAENESKAIQVAAAEQTGGGHDRCRDKDKCDPCDYECHDGCKSGCGSDGQFQALGQVALTSQDADADAYADQNAVNGNAPVAIAGGDIDAGDSTTEQTAENAADAKAKNESKTVQLAFAEQTGGSSSCHAGCGGDGQFQAVLQAAATKQKADADATAVQNAVNENTPVAQAGGDVDAGDSSAAQHADNAAEADAGNESKTAQLAKAEQAGQGSCANRCHDRCKDRCEKSCKWHCGGHGQAQVGKQLALTFQRADADADADQNAVNGNAPVAIAGGDVHAGDSSAEQTANNRAAARARNESLTLQLLAALQSPW